MAKTKISEYDALSSNNTDVDSINIAEGCAPSGINNAIREVMAHLKDFQQGTNGDPFNGPVNGTVGATTPAAGAFTTLSASGAVTLSGGTANGVFYANGSKVVTSGSALWFDGTNFGVGTGGNTLNHQSVVYKVGANAVYQQIANGSTGLGGTNGVRLGVSNGGTGELYSPTALISYVDNTEAMRLTSTGLGIGTSSPAEKLDVNGNINASSSYSTSGDGFMYSYNGGAVGAVRSGIQFAGSTNNMVFYTGQNQVARIDSSGNLGLGVTPSAWSSGGQLQLADNKAICSSGQYINLGSNWYYSGGFKYISTAAASNYEQNAGAHKWFTAPSGTAGNAISFTQALSVGHGTSLALQGATSQTGTGITFPATQNASSSANTLDDYEEGFWTPTLSSTGTAPTVSAYETRSGYYTKVGNLVTISCFIRATISNAGSGSPTITGIPFSDHYGYPGVAPGLRNLLSGGIPAGANTYLGGSVVYFDGCSYITVQNNYITFTITYSLVA